MITDRSEIESAVRSLGPWFHNLDLNGVLTAPEHFLGDYPRQKFQRFAHVIPDDLSGMSVLDVGCNAGFYTLEMKRRGADRVVGVDSDERYLEQARFAARVTGLEVEFRKLSVYEVDQLGERFDFVIFMGVLYHLRHPLLALDLLWEYAVGEKLLFQSMLRGRLDLFVPEEDYPFSNEKVFEEMPWPRMFFIENRYAADPTNWWVPDASCVTAMLRSAGFDPATRAEDEVFLCDRVERPDMGTREDYVPAKWRTKI